MVKVTVIENLLSKKEMSMSRLVRDIVKKLELEGEYSVSDKVNEGMLRHGAVRRTLPKDANIRRALLAIAFEKEYSKVTGKDLCSIILKNSLEVEIENHFKKMQFPNFEDLVSFKQEKFGNLIKNYQYGSYSEIEFVETAIVLTLIRDSNLRYIKDKKAILNYLTSYIIGEEDVIEKSISLALPLSKVGKAARINAYRFIIGKLLEIR